MLLVLSILIVLILIASYFISKFTYINKSYLNRKTIYLELTPPENTLQTPLATKELFTFIHNLTIPYKKWQKILLFIPKHIYSFEIISSKEKGIRYVICIPIEIKHSIKKALYSYLPGLKINEVPDDLNIITQNKSNLCYEMILGNNFVFPLAVQTQLPQHDPIAYITGNMTKLADGEEVMMQVLASPITSATHTYLSRKLRRLSLEIINEKLRFGILRRKHIIENPIYHAFYIDILIDITFFIGNIIFFPINAFFYLFTVGNIKSIQKEKLTNGQQNLYKEMSAKLQQELFQVSCRFFVASNNLSTTESRMNGLVASLATYRNSPYQGLIKRQSIGRNNFKELYRLKSRTFSLMQIPILSVTELSNLYHLPYTDTTKTEDIVKSKTKYLPIDLRLKNEKNFDIVFAQNSHDGKRYHIGLTKEERMRHAYIMGATGTGKTTLLKSMIQSDIHKGNGICVIDPHGDLIEQILSIIPKNRVEDVVYFNPSDISHPIGLNILELEANLDEDELLREKDLIASNMISLFSKLYPPRYMGPRMENIIRNAVLTVLETENPTLFTVQRLLVDNKYRKKITESLKDPVLKLFWTKEFQQLGSFQKAEAVSPITNKIGRFITSPHTRYILGQTQSTINFNEIMDSNKILLCNLSKGRIGEDISTLFGGIITAKIQLAALRRATIDESKRNDFYVYIDEFQNFATQSFAQILSEARKYHLGAILAHQTTAQIEDKDLLKVILANVGTTISFRTGSPADEDLLLNYFSPYITKGELSNIPNLNFYMKINAITPTNVFSGETLPFLFVDSEKANHVKTKVIDNSRKRYASDKSSIEESIVQTFSDLVNTQTQTMKKYVQNKSSILPD